jgi:hypothetical protein
LFARLSVSGARIVSVPVPLVTQKTPPANLQTQPLEALQVMKHFERALPPHLALTAELVPRLAAAIERPAPVRPRSLARRIARRLLAR